MKTFFGWVPKGDLDYLRSELNRARGLLELAAIETMTYKRTVGEMADRIVKEGEISRKEIGELKQALADERSMASTMATILSGKEVYDAFQQIEKEKVLDVYPRLNREWRRS